MARGRAGASRRAPGEGIRGTFKPQPQHVPMSIAEFFFDDGPTAPEWQLTGVADSREWRDLDPGKDTRPVCEHCGRPIRNVYRCQRRDGIILHLGSECVTDYLGMSGEKAHAKRRREAAQRERRDTERSLQIERQRLADEAFERDRDVYDLLRARDTTDRGFGRQHVLDDMSQRVKADPLLVLSERQIAYARVLITREAELVAKRAADVPKTFIDGYALPRLETTLTSAKVVNSGFGPMARVIFTDGDGHRYMYRTGSGTRAGVMLLDASRGDRFVIEGATVTGQTEDRCLTFIRRPRVSAA